MPCYQTIDKMSRWPPARKVVVVGAGPVGCLAALAFAKHGWSVDLFEARPGLSKRLISLPCLIKASIEDIRLLSSKMETQQRSINLAVSHRGIVALEAIDPAATQRLMQSAIPMRGRMVHKSNGDLDSQLYDRDGQVSV